MILLPLILLALLAAVHVWGAAILGQHFSAPALLTIHHVLMVTTLIVATLLLDGFIRHFYWHRYWRRRRGRETPALIKDLLTVALVLLGASLGLWWQVGMSFTGLITASGATAIILGIALQTVIQDLFSGLSINLDGSYALGDWLTIYSDQLQEPVYGRVTAMTWRSTFLSLEDGRRLMVPNHLVTANPVLNHSRPREAKRYRVEIMADNRVPVARMMEMLLGEAMKTVREHGMAANPPPYVHVDRTAPDAIFYHVCFYAWPDILTPSHARSRMLIGQLRAIQHNTVPMPVTQIEMTAAPDISSKLDGEDVLRGLHHVDLFADTLDVEEMSALAAHCRVRDFPPGAGLMQQGDEASSMLILLAGAARVTVHGASGTEEEVAVLAGGDFVGEMSLLTGAPRSATVTALTALRALEVKKDDIAPLLQKNPGVLHKFSEALAVRQEGLAAAAKRTVPLSAGAAGLLARMRGFFLHPVRH
jgi:small-conductance mechanosensitive channel/CRP-like cAMP-binding protein